MTSIALYGIIKVIIGILICFLRREREKLKEIYDKIQDINIILKRSFIDLGKPLAYQEVVEKSAKVLDL